MGIKDKLLLPFKKFNQLKLSTKILIGVLIIALIVFVLNVAGVITLPGQARASSSTLPEDDSPPPYNEADWEYKVVFENKSWDDHRAAALDWGGDLLSVSSPEEEAVINTLVGTQSTKTNAVHHLWIGGRYKEGSSDIPPKNTLFMQGECPEDKFCTDDAGSDTYWEWTDGTQWTHANWTARNREEGPFSEPNNNPGTGYVDEKCVHTSIRMTDGAYDPVLHKNEEGSYGSWNDNSCGKLMGAIYKRKLS